MSNTKQLDEALRDPAPEIARPIPTIVTLQRGLVDPASGEWQTRSEVRELTGGDEEYLASLETKAEITYSEYMTALLKRAVVSIGHFDIPSHPELIDHLSIGDRDILFLGIVKATYGYEREFVVTCPSCNKKNDVTINIDDDFPIQPPSLNLQEPIVVELRGGHSVRLRLPNGSDSLYVSKHSTSTATQNTMMLSRCAILSPEELAGRTPDEWAKSLNIADRSKMVKALLDVKAGPRMEGVNVQCAHCTADMPLNLNWMSLLFG